MLPLCGGLGNGNQNAAEAGFVAANDQTAAKTEIMTSLRIETIFPSAGIVASPLPFCELKFLPNQTTGANVGESEMLASSVPKSCPESQTDSSLSSRIPTTLILDMSMEIQAIRAGRLSFPFVLLNE